MKLREPLSDHANFSSTPQSNPRTTASTRAHHAQEDSNRAPTDTEPSSAEPSPSTHLSSAQAADLVSRPGLVYLVLEPSESPKLEGMQPPASFQNVGHFTSPVFERNLPAHLHVEPLPGLGSGHMQRGYVYAQITMIFERKGWAPVETRDDYRFEVRPALVDTGATVSLIDSALVPIIAQTPIKETKMNLNGLGQTQTVGCIVQPFMLEAIQFQQDQRGSYKRDVVLHIEHEFHIVHGLGPGVILGMDFIHGHGLRLDPQGGRLEMDEGICLPLRCLDTRALQRATPPAGDAPADAEKQQPEAPGTELRPDSAECNVLSHELTPPPIPTSTSDSPTSVARSTEASGPTSVPSTASRPIALVVQQGCIVPARSERWVCVTWGRTPSPSDTFLTRPTCWADESQDIHFSVKASLISPGCKRLLVTNFGHVDAPVPSNLPLTVAEVFSGQAASGGPPYQLSTWNTVLKQTTPPEFEAHVFAADVHIATDEDFISRFHIGDDSDSGQANAEIIALLHEFKDAFSLDGTPGKADAPPFCIRIKDGRELIPEPARRAPPEKRKVIDEAIDQMLAWDVIEPSDSSTSYPVLLVRQNDKWRFCVDFRGLNEVTVTDTYPLPRADDIFDNLSGSTIFSALDAVKGHHQLPVAEEDRWKTAFTCHRGLFQYKRIPFGLKNAPAWFQRLMDSMLGATRWNGAMVYLDDIIVYSSRLDHHLNTLRFILSRAKDMGLKFDPKKCHFALPSLKLLGRRVSAEGVSILEDRAETIRDIQPPKNLEQLTKFLGLMQYYRHFIPRFAEVAAPLQNLTKGTHYGKKTASGKAPLILPSGERTSAARVLLNWQPDHQTSFDKLKKLLAEATCLSFPDMSKRFFLYIDASQSSFAAALHQQSLRPLPESSPNRDHSRDSVSPSANAPVFVTDEDRDDTQHEESPLPPMMAAPDDEWRTKLIRLQKEDPAWGQTVRRLADGHPTRGYAMDGDILIRASDDKICLPKALFREALELAHRGHFGFRCTMDTISSTFWHPRLAEAVRSFVKHCATCIRTKEQPHTGHIEPDDDYHGTPFHTISIDKIEGLPSSNGLEMCLIIVDLFTKAVLLRAMPKKSDATQIANAVQDLVVRAGWQPQRVISDHDSLFVGEVAQCLAKLIGWRITPTAPYHQQANPVERYVQTVSQALRALCLDKLQTVWPDLLGPVELAMNASVSSVTGYAPHDLIYVHRPRLLEKLLGHTGVDAIEEQFHFAASRVQQATEAVRHAQEQHSQRYNDRRRPLPALEPGTKVMIRLRDRPLLAHRLNSRLDARLEGAFEVESVLSPHRVRLKLPASLKVNPEFDVTQLQVVPSPDEYGRPHIANQSQSSDWVPQMILDERIFNNRHKQYLVKWENCDLLEWTFADDLIADGFQELVDIWNDARDGMATPPLDPRQAIPAAAIHTALASLQQGESGASTEEPHFTTAAEAMSKPIHRPQVVSVEGQRMLLEERPIAFASCLTSKKESKMLGLELEATGLHWAFNHFRHLLQGASISVITDHAPLASVMLAPSHREFGPRIEWIRSQLAPYLHQMRFHYKPGHLHVNVDSLSRLNTDADAADDS